MQLKSYFNQFQAAIIQFSRIPIKSEHLTGSHFAESVNFLPLVGAVIGFLSAIPVFLLSPYLEGIAEAWLLVIFAVMLTGAIHEDGLADCSDGLFGGHDRSQRLKIMKDSTLGTYAVLGLIAVIGLKVSLLANIPSQHLLTIFIIGHAVSRIAPLIVMLTSDYTEHNPSIKMTKQSETNIRIFFISSGLIIMLSLVFLPIKLTLLFILISFITPLFLKSLFEQKIGGYNGDCLGATQQVTECLLLLAAACYY